MKTKYFDLTKQVTIKTQFQIKLKHQVKGN